jgi:hypothetical protein
MRAVRSLGSLRVRSFVLPLLLGALALRFLIPAGFMPTDAPGMSLTVALCSTQGASENIEIPGAPTGTHCEQCMAPSMGTPLVMSQFASLSLETEPSPSPPRASQIPDALLARAQSPRAPPQV